MSVMVGEASRPEALLGAIQDICFHWPLRHCWRLIKTVLARATSDQNFNKNFYQVHRIYLIH